MVDLVKIRKKAKEKKDAEKAAETPEAAANPNDATPPAAEAPAAPEPPEAPAPETPSDVIPQPGRTVSAGASAPLSAPADPKPEVSPAPAKPAPDSTAAETPKSSSKLDKFKETAGQKALAAEKKTAEAVEEETQQELELLTFRLAAESYAIEIEKIVEIVPPRTTTRIPNADETIVGIISLRGTIVTVLDLRKKLGHPASPGETADTRMIVVEHEGETAGFVVDRVSRVIKLDPAQLESPPVVNASEQNDYIRGVFQQGSTLTILLDLNRILGR